MQEKGSRSKKVDDLFERVQDCIEQNRYTLTSHALERRIQREIELPDILHILKYGYHENMKDIWDPRFETWNYAIRGKTIDKEDIRVIVSFDPDRMLIITVIRLK